MADKWDQNTLTGVDWIDRNPLFIAVGSSLQKPEKQGNDLKENELFDEVDTEMMKRGTLNHSSIRWDWVCEQCAKLLSQESKDFRLLLYILQSLPNVKNYSAPLTLGTVLTSRFIGIWGDVAYPITRKRLPTIRKIIDALETLIDHSKKFNLEQENIELSARSLRQCVDFFKKFDRNFEQQIFSMANSIEAAVIADENDGSHSLEKIIKEPFKPKPILEIKDNDGSSQTLELHPENLVLNEKSERALKQSLTIVADFILHMDIENPLSYRLRRFATWYGITNAPEQRRKDDLKTVILPVSANALDEYRTAAERGQTDFDIAYKLERSCHNQPFWIEGQYLAYKLAVICNRQLAAEAIYETTYSFVNKTDWLKRLQFADGSPFMPDAVRTWIETYDRASTTGASHLRVQENEMIGSEMQAIVLEAREKANHGNTNEAIRILESAKPNQDTPRSKTLWEMLMLECISDWGMKNLVSAQAKRLKTDIENMMVKDYEPDIINRISRLEITKK